VNHRFARELRKNMAPAESRLWGVLRHRQILGYKFRRQAPIGSYTVDFVCFEKKIVVELDGAHHTETVEEDDKRTSWLASQGFRLLRFVNNDVFERMDSVKEEIIRALQAPTA
jgi:very-short-patch-repair endonuclease